MHQRAQLIKRRRRSKYDPKFDKFMSNWNFLKKMFDRDKILSNQESRLVIKVNLSPLKAQLIKYHKHPKHQSRIQ